VYGTVARMRAKPGQEAKLNELSDRWWRERGQRIKGAMSSTMFRTDKDPSEFILVAVFDNKENYEANANDPQQDAWYKEFAACLEGDPMWMDGEVVFAQHRH